MTAPPDHEAEHRRSAEVSRRHRSQRRRRRQVALSVQVGVFAVLMVVWWAVAAAEVIRPLYLPGPGAVWQAFLDANRCRPISEGSERLVCGEQGYYLWGHLLASLQRMGVGVGLAVVLGPVVGFLMGSIAWVRVAVEPYLNFVRALPPLGYLGLLIVWFGIGDLSKYWLLFLAAFPPIVIATMNGLRGIREDRVQAARSMGAGRRQVALHVVLPSALPDIINGVRIAVGFAWTTVVAAELQNGIPGIGGLAFQAGVQLRTPLVIACIIVIGLAAIALDSLINRLGQVLVPWQGRA